MVEGKIFSTFINNKSILSNYDKSKLELKPVMNRTCKWFPYELNKSKESFWLNGMTTAFTTRKKDTLSAFAHHFRS